MKLKVDRNILILYTGLIIYIISTMFFSIFINIAALIGFIFIIFIGQFNNKKDVIYNTHVLLLPIMLSAFQNVYLGLVAYNLTNIQLQLALSLNIVVYMVVFATEIFDKKNKKNEITIMIFVLILTIQSVMMYIIYTSSLSSFAGCFRNIISCILIYFCALKLGNKINIDLFFEIIKGI